MIPVRPVVTIALLALACPAPALAHDFVDSRLTVTFGDDDLLRDAGEGIPDSPLIGFGDRQPGYELFYDNLNTRYTSRESLTHLVFHRQLPGYFEDVTTEFALVLLAEFWMHKNDGVALRDSGSYIRVTYSPFDDPDDGLALTVFPFDSDRFRLGYLYDLSVAGNDMFPRKRWYSAPGARLRLDYGPGFYFAGFKAVLSQSELSESANEQGTTLQTAENETLYAALVGLGWDLLEDQLRIELAAGYIEQARNPIVGVAGELVYAVGGAGRVVFHHNLPIEDSLDFALYRNDPNNPFIAFAPVSYSPDELGFSASAETIVLTQRLADPALIGQTTYQDAYAAAVRLRLQQGYLRTGLTVVARSLSFMLASTPSLAPFTAFGESANVSSEIFASAAADYHFPELHLTVGGSAGVRMPPHVRTKLYSKTDPAAQPTLIGENVLVVDGRRGRIILPEGESVSPTFAGRLQARLDLSDLLYTLLWVQYLYDGNTSIVEINADLTKSRVVGDPHSFGLGVSAAVRL